MHHVAPLPPQLVPLPPRPPWLAPFPPSPGGGCPSHTVNREDCPSRPGEELKGHAAVLRAVEGIAAGVRTAMNTEQRRPLRPGRLPHRQPGVHGQVGRDICGGSTKQVECRVTDIRWIVSGGTQIYVIARPSSAAMSPHPPIIIHTPTTTPSSGQGPELALCYSKAVPPPGGANEGGGFGRGCDHHAPLPTEVDVVVLTTTPCTCGVPSTRNLAFRAD